MYLVKIILNSIVPGEIVPAFQVCVFNAKRDYFNPSSFPPDKIYQHLDNKIFIINTARAIIIK
jgi:hypothetical protein